MKLRLKIFALLTVSYLLIFVVLEFASYSFLLKGMENLETEDVIKNTTMSLQAFSHKIKEIDEAASRFSSYSDIYLYTRSSKVISEEYVLSIFTDAVLSEADINFVFLFDSDGEVVFDKGFNLVGNTKMVVPMELINFFEMNSILVTHSEPQSKLTGILNTPSGLMLISSRAISAGRDLIVGSVVLCRNVDSHLENDLMNEALLNFDLIPISGAEAFAEYREVINKIKMDTPVYVSKLDQDTVSGFTVMNDLYGKQVILIRADSPRLIYQQGIQMVSYFVLSFALIGISIGMLVILALNRLVIMPLSKLSHEVSDINPSTISDTSVEIAGNDEISGLSKDIDKMLGIIRTYQDKMKETERMASIGATATMVGHDLRNPLQVVFILTDLIRNKINRFREKSTEPELEELERLNTRIKDQAVYMNKVVSDLQGLTKGVSLEVEDVDIVEMIYDIMDVVQIPPNIQYNLVFDEEFPEIYADDAKLRRVFTNLIANAVQAMTNGGELVIKGHKEGDVVSVSVVDTGCGIPEEIKERIFNPLFTTKAKGTGLGLTVCKHITEAHGGEILLKSTPGVGTCFTIILPIKNRDMGLNQGQNASLEYAIPQEFILPNNI